MVIYFQTYFFGNFNQFIVSINSITQTTNYKYNFTNDINNVRIIFNSPVTSTDRMFHQCNKIIEINLSKFDTSLVNQMPSMFSFCTSLVSLDLTNFNTSLVTSMNSMFMHTVSLKSLDLSSFNTSLVINTACMFGEMTSINTLDLSNFDLSNVNSKARMFYSSSKLEYINFKIAKINQFENINEAFASTPKNLIISCENDNDILMSFFQDKKFIYCNNKDSIHQIKYICYMKNSTLYNKYVCDICGQNFYQNYHIINEVDEPYIDCFEIIDEYYLNKNSWSYEPCYDTCKTCEISGDESQHNCITCKDNFNGRINADLNYINCDKLDFLDTYKLEDIIINESDETIQDIIFDLINEFNIDDLDNGRDKIIIDNKKRTIKLTSTSNQKNNEEENEITMDLGQCETILKREYHIPDDDPLYILQIISEEEGMKIPKLEYEVYYPLYDNYLKKLNITLCKDTKVEISIPVNISGTLDKYNPKSDYYNDICSRATSDFGTDISLKDRRNEFVENNLTLCEENCELIEYNYEKQKAKCSCDVKLSIPPDYDIKFNKNEFFKSFTDVNNILNLSILKCYKIVLQIKKFKNNYGFMIIGFIFLLYLITLLVFLVSSFEKLKKEIKKIIFALKSNDIQIKDNKISKKPIIIRNQIKEKTKKHIKESKNDYIKNKDEKLNKKLSLKYLKKKQKNLSNFPLMNKINSKNPINPIKAEKKFSDILDKKDFELNSLD